MMDLNCQYELNEKKTTRKKRLLNLIKKKACNSASMNYLYFTNNLFIEIDLSNRIILLLIEQLY